MAQKKPSMTGLVKVKIRDLAVGESVFFPIERMGLIRTMTSNCNAIYGGRRRTRTVPAERRIYVIRDE